MNGLWRDGSSGSSSEESRDPDSGSGLHLILRLAPPARFPTEGERSKWAGLVRVIQRVLPSDPNALGSLR